SVLHNDGFYDSEWLPQTLQHRPLLNVKFDVRQNIISQRSFRNLIRIQTKILNRFPNRNALPILTAEKFLVYSSNQRAAPDERNSKPHSLFFRKADGLDPKRQLLAIQRFHQRDRQHDTQYSIECPCIRHRVQMRSHQDSRRSV